MNKIMFVSDAFKSDLDHVAGVGGAEKSDAALIEKLSADFNVTKVLSKDYTPDSSVFTIFSNCTRLPLHHSSHAPWPTLSSYSIIHHDYQLIYSRNPYAPNNKFVPSMLKLIDGAITNYYQTDFHQSVSDKLYENANKESLSCTFFSNHELIYLQNKWNSNDSWRRRHKFVICNNPAPLKGTKEAELMARKMGLPYELIDPMPYEDFIAYLSLARGLVFTPLTPETCCRLVIESKCVGTPVITSLNYGATSADWFFLSGLELIDKIRELNNNAYNSIKKNIDNFYE